MKLLDAIIERAANPPREGVRLFKVEVGPYAMTCIKRQIKAATGLDVLDKSVWYKGILIQGSSEGFGTHRIDLTWVESLTRDLAPLLEE